MSDHSVTLREPGAPPGGMLCPACGLALVMAERQGVEIDYCPKCRGIWLDRGEIEKIIERSLEQEAGRGGQRAAAYPEPLPGNYPGQGYQGDHGDGHHGGGHGYGGYGGGGHGRYGRHGRRSWLRDLFD